MQQKLFLLVVMSLMFPTFLFAAGKLRGRVVDKDSREALLGANVSVDGTSMGAATNVDGEYIVLNVPAGVYTLKATFVGYSSVTISNIRVNNDLTTSQDFHLTSEAVALQAVEIVAERPLVNKNATNAVRITTSEDIASIPVRGINNVIALSAGVVLQDNTVFIRGGRQDEVGFYLDGVSITNPNTGGRAVNIVQDAVEEIQVQTGGYNAEFGGANSGIIQQQLKTGTSDCKVSAQYITDNVTFQPKSKAFSGEKRLGANWFGYSEFTGSLSGPVFSDQFKFFGLFNYQFQRDQTPQPYPGINIGRIVGQTGDTIDLTYPAGALLKNPITQYSYTGTLTMDFNPLAVRLSGIYNTQTTFNAYNTHRNAGQISNMFNTGRIEQADGINGSASAKLTYLISPTTFAELTGGYFFQTTKNFDPVLEDNFLSYGDSAANAQAGYIWSRSANDVRAGNTGRFIRPTRKSLYSFQFNAPGDLLSAYVKNKRESISLTGALSAQLGSQHSLKIGGEFQRYTMRRYAWGNDAVFSLAGLLFNNDQLPDNDPNKLTREQVLINAGVDNFGYDVFGNESNQSGISGAKHPVFASAYVQDKIEYNDLVVNLGFRFDYINTDNKALVDPERPERTIDPTSGVIDPNGLVDVPSFQSVSPRLGLSFPVTDQTVFHAQFGKFVQQSRLRDIYQGLYLTAANVRGGFFIGTPVGFNVRPTRTTQYEIGFRQQVGDFASFDITGYYKDIKDQVVFEQQNTAQGSPLGAYFVFTNGDFATTKGVELTFNMRRQKRIQVNAFLAFQDAQGTGSFPNSARGIVGAPLDGVTLFKPQYISPLEFNNSVRGNLNIDYRFDANDGGPVLEQLGISTLISFNSGHPYTRGIGGASLESDARSRQPVEALNASVTPWNFQVDVRIDKSFRLFNAVNANLFVQVINLLDTRNVENVFLRTGSTDDDGYLSDPSLGGPLIATYGPRFVDVYRAIDVDYYETYQNAPFLNTVPYFYGPPRQVRLGMRLEM